MVVVVSLAAAATAIDRSALPFINIVDSFYFFSSIYYILILLHTCTSVCNTL